MYRAEITLHCCPAFTFTDSATKRLYPLICPQPRRQEAPTWREEVEFVPSSVRLIIWCHLGLSAHLLRVKLSEISQRESGDFFYGSNRRWKPVSVSLTDSWRRWDSEALVGVMQKLIFVDSLGEISTTAGTREKHDNSPMRQCVCSVSAITCCIFEECVSQTTPPPLPWAC